MTEYINKQELLAKIESDMATGKLSQKDGNRLIRYIMQAATEEEVYQ